MTPDPLQPFPPPAGTRIAAGCGGALLGISLTIGIGGLLLWFWAVKAVESLKGDSGFGGFGVAAVFLYGLVVLAVLAVIAGTIGGAACAVAANRIGRVPVTAMAGFPMAGCLVVGYLLLQSGVLSANMAAAPVSAVWGVPRQTGPARAPAGTATAAPTPDPPSEEPVPPAVSSPDNGVRYARPERKPTVDEIKEFARQAERDAPSVLGEWLYPGARAIPFTPDGGAVTYPLLGLQTADDFETVIAFYERLAPGGERRDEAYFLHGKRPSDGRPTEIFINANEGKTFVRFDAR